MNSVAAVAQYQFQTCPIILTGGIATGISGGWLPIISLLSPGAFPGGPTSPAFPDFGLDDAIANFMPVPNGSLQRYDLGRYPFANQITAANAIITEPLNISLVMIMAFAPGAASVPNRQAIMTSLKQTLSQHALAGGTYAVNTISYPYQNAILRDLRDSSGSEITISQWRWTWDFEIPLISLQDAANYTQSPNNLMSRLSNGQMVQPGPDGSNAWSGTQPTVGNPGSGAAPSVIPATQQSPLMGNSPQ